MLPCVTLSKVTLCRSKKTSCVSLTGNEQTGTGQKIVFGYTVCCCVVWCVGVIVRRNDDSRCSLKINKEIINFYVFHQIEEQDSEPLCRATFTSNDTRRAHVS